MAHQLSCWRCGESLSALTLPLSRLDECPACAIHLHVCRMCQHFDRNIAEQCRNDDAEHVKEKERPNFCDFFAPSETAFKPGAGADGAARDALEGLFGGDAPEAKPDVDDDLEALFRKD